MWVGGNSRYDGFERVKEERSRVLENVNAYKMMKKKLERTLLKKKVGMKVMKRSVVDFKKIVNCPETKKSFLTKVNEELTY